MITGYQTLEEIEKIIRMINDDLRRLDEKSDALFERSQQNKKEQSDILRQIAVLQLSAPENTQTDTDILNRDILALLEQRKIAFQKLQDEIARTEAKIRALEVERQEAHKALDQAARAVIDKEHEIQALLEKDAAYQKQLDAVRKAKSIAQEADTKAQEAQKRREEKGKIYEESPFFAYLWERHYDTPQYQEGGLTKMLDEWIAKGSNYEPNRVNYHLLLEIPKRLFAHAQEAKKSYQKSLEALAMVEHAKADALGLSLLQKSEADHQAKVDAIDDAIETAEHTRENLLLERTKFIQEQDSDAQRILDLINTRLQHMTLPQLDRLAESTLSREDDRLVALVERLKEEYERMQESIEAIQRQYEKKIDRLKEIEKVRSRFKRSRYDDIRSGFDRPNEIADVLGGLVGGLLNSDVIWETLRRSQRHIDTGAWPDFGSGGMAQGQAPWHFPTPREEGSGFGFPDIGGGFSSRNPSNTGFSTGGGF